MSSHVIFCRSGERKFARLRAVKVALRSQVIETSGTTWNDDLGQIVISANNPAAARREPRRRLRLYRVPSKVVGLWRSAPR